MKILLTTKEAAKQLRVLPQTLENWRHLGKGLRYSKVGGAVRYEQSAIDEWLADNEVVPTPKTEATE